MADSYKVCREMPSGPKPIDSKELSLVEAIELFVKTEVGGGGPVSIRKVLEDGQLEKPTKEKFSDPRLPQTGNPKWPNKR